MRPPAHAYVNTSGRDLGGTTIHPVPCDHSRNYKSGSV